MDSAKNVDKLNSVARRDEVRSDGYRPMALEENGVHDRVGGTVARLAERVGDALRELGASGRRERDDRQAREEERRLGQRPRIRGEAGQRQRQRHWDMGMDDGGNV